MQSLYTTLCYTTTESCHKLWPLCTFCKCTVWICVHMLRSVCVSACMRAYVRVCMCAYLWCMNTVRMLQVCELSTSAYSETKRDNTAVLSNTHVQYIHTDWVWRQNNKHKCSHTLDYCGTTDTLWEPCILKWLHLITVEKVCFFHNVAVCSESFVVFFKFITWFRDQHIFSTM